MSRTEVKSHISEKFLNAGNSKVKIVKTFCAGFSLVEMLVVLSLFGVVAVIASGFLIASLGSSSRAEISKEVRQNGNFALSVMEGLILSSKSVTCPTKKQVTVTDIRGNNANFLCEDSADCGNSSKCKIASSSALGSVDLTGDNVAVSACNFVCFLTAGKPSKVAIDFTVSQRTSTQRPNERSSMKFQTEVMTKNY